jgi:hypothetical protein
MKVYVVEKARCGRGYYVAVIEPGTDTPLAISTILSRGAAQVLAKVMNDHEAAKPNSAAEPAP